MVQAVCVSDTRILDRMFRENNSWLVGWIRRQARSQSSAEDIASDVFLKLLAMGNLDTVREPRAILAVIARRTMIELFRRSELQRAYEAELAALPESYGVTPERQMIMIEALQAIDQILAGFSVRARTAFLMSQVEGMKYADIAAEIGVSVSMVRRYIAQGLLRFYGHHPDDV